MTGRDLLQEIFKLHEYFTEQKQTVPGTFVDVVDLHVLEGRYYFTANFFDAYECSGCLNSCLFFYLVSYSVYNCSFISFYFPVKLFNVPPVDWRAILKVSVTNVVNNEISCHLFPMTRNL